MTMGLRRSRLGRRIIPVAALMTGVVVVGTTPAWADDHTYVTGTGSAQCLVTVGQAIYHNAGRDDRWFAADGHFTCQSKATLTVTIALTSGNANRLATTKTFKNVASGSWTVTSKCDLSVPSNLQADEYIHQRIKFESSKGPWMLGATPDAHGLCDVFD